MVKYSTPQFPSSGRFGDLCGIRALVGIAPAASTSARQQLGTGDKCLT